MILVSGRLLRKQGRVGIRLSRGKGGLRMVCGGWVGIGLSRGREGWDKFVEGGLESRGKFLKKLWCCVGGRV